MRATLRLLSGILLAAVTVADAADAPAPTFTLAGKAGSQQVLGVADLQKLPVRDVNVADPHSKQQIHYRGVGLPALLALASAPLGDKLRGPALATFVTVAAADGYRVVFSLAELDGGVGNTDAILAFEADGKPLAAEAGPFRLVVPTDKRGARWVRQVTKIEVIGP